MQIKYILNSQSKPPSPLRKFAALVATAALVSLVLMFSAVLLAVIAIIGTVAGGYLWWKTRHVRKMMRDLQHQEMAPHAEASNDAVFEGKVIRVVDPRDVR
jgi:uncharacterized protein HemX